MEYEKVWLNGTVTGKLSKIPTSMKAHQKVNKFMHNKMRLQKGWRLNETLNCTPNCNLTTNLTTNLTINGTQNRTPTKPLL